MHTPQPTLSTRGSIGELACPASSAHVRRQGGCGGSPLDHNHCCAFACVWQCSEGAQAIRVQAPGGRQEHASCHPPAAGINPPMNSRRGGACAAWQQSGVPPHAAVLVPAGGQVPPSPLTGQDPGGSEQQGCSGRAPGNKPKVLSESPALATHEVAHQADGAK